jgi:hypothetical protein
LRALEEETVPPSVALIEESAGVDDPRAEPLPDLPAELDRPFDRAGRERETARTLLEVAPEALLDVTGARDVAERAMSPRRTPARADLSW